MRVQADGQERPETAFPVWWNPANLVRAVWRGIDLFTNPYVRDVDR